MTTAERKVEIFKYTIEFLKIYGQENFGESAEVNWCAIFEHCTKCDMLDFNQEVEQLVYNTKEEDFRDAVFTYLEKQALEGYPLWRLFKMSKWLYNACESQLLENERKKDIEYFYKTKCYHCRYFMGGVRVTYATIIEPLNIKEYPNFETFKKQHPNATIKDVRVTRGCAKREELAKEALKKAGYDSSWRSEHFLREYKHKYKRFRSDARGNWILIPNDLKCCPYFEENGVQPEQFIELFTEIPRFTDEEK